MLLRDRSISLDSAARKPSVAAIDGLALGGGLELSMVRVPMLSTTFPINPLETVEPGELFSYLLDGDTVV